MKNLLNKLTKLDAYLEDERIVSEYALSRKTINATKKEFQSLLDKLNELGYDNAQTIAQMFGLQFIDIRQTLKSFAPNNRLTNDILIDIFEEDDNIYLHFFSDLD